MDKTNKELQRLLLEQREKTITHMPFEKEMLLYKRIQMGVFDYEKRGDKPYPNDEMGVLSDNPIRNGKYHLIILTSMITRFCVEGGLEPETAYTLSDIFIRRIDKTTNLEEINNLFKEICTEFNSKMIACRKNREHSLYVKRAVEYIDSNITQNISSSQVADMVKISRGYLNTLFKQELGSDVTTYINKKKCESAAYILANSDFSCTEVSAFYGFASCSYFVKKFKEVYNETPAGYRKRIFRNTMTEFGYK